MAHVLVNPKEFRDDVAQELDINEISTSATGIYPQFARQMHISGENNTPRSKSGFAVETLIEPPFQSLFIPIFIRFVKFASVFFSGQWLFWRLYTSIQISREPTIDHEGRDPQDSPSQTGKQSQTEVYHRWLDEEGSWFILLSPWYRRFDSMLPLKPLEWSSVSQCCLENPKLDDRPVGDDAFEEELSMSSFGTCRDLICPILCFRRANEPPLYRCAIGWAVWSALPLFSWMLVFFGSMVTACYFFPPLIIKIVWDTVQLCILLVWLLGAAILEPFYHCWQRYRMFVEQDEGAGDGFSLLGRVVSKNDKSRLYEVARVTLANNVNFWKALKLQLDTTHKYITVNEFLMRNPLWGFFEKSVPIPAIVNAWFELVDQTGGEFPIPDESAGFSVPV